MPGRFRPVKSPLLRVLPLLALLSSPLSSATTSAALADLRAKAERGNAVAQYNLGLIYADLNEPVADLAEAFVWLNLAAENGATGKGLKSLTDQMTPAQLAEGKRRLSARRTTLAQAAQISGPITPSAERSPVSAAAAGPVTAPVSSSAPSPVAPVSAPAPAPANAEVERLQQEIEALQADKKQLSTELANAWRETEAAKNASIGKVGELNQQIASRDQEIARLKAEAAQASASRPSDVSNADLAKAREEAARSAQARIDAEAARDKLSRDLAAVSSEVSALKAQLASEQKARADLSTQSISATQAAATQASELQALRDQVKAAQAALESEKTARASLNEQLQRVSAEKTTLAALASGASHNAQQQAASLQQDVERLRAELAARDQNLTRIEEERRRLNAEVESSRKAAQDGATSAAELAAARSRIAELEGAVATLTAEREARPASADTTGTPADPAQVEALNKQVADVQAKLAAALRTYTLQRAELERTQKALADIDQERAGVAERLASTTLERDAASRALSEANAAAAEANQLREQLTAARLEADTLRARTAELTPLANETNSLREQLRQTQQQSAALALEVNQLKTRLALAAPPPGSSLASPTRPGTNASVANTTPAAPAATSPTVSFSAPAPGSAGPSPATPVVRQHTVVAGDSLTRIARRYYGDPNRWTDIVAANREAIVNPNVLIVGSTLRIP